MGRILSFNDRVSLALRIVQESYPNARLYEAGGVSTEGSTTNPKKIDQMQVLCMNPDGSTVFINEAGAGNFNKPVLIEGNSNRDRAIHWPIAMDLSIANQLKEDAGYISPYRKVTLRTPMAPIRFNPYFVFGHDVESYVFVDTITGIVHAGR